MILRTALAPLVVGTVLALTACNSGGNTDAGMDGALDVPPSGMAVHIPFAGMVGTLPFDCTMTYANLGTTHTMWQPEDFRMYISNVRLLSAGGVEAPVSLDEDGVWQHEGVALLDFENRTGTCSNGTTQTNTQLIGHVAPGTYTGIRFDVGVPFAIDHQNVSLAQSPLDVDSLFWSWEGGYMFLRLDGTTTGQPGGYNIHLGSVGCTADPSGGVSTPCSSPNLTEITLTGFDPTSQVIVADVALLTSDSNLDQNSGGTSSGCMSDLADPDCVPIFAHLDLPYESAPAPGTQQFFRVAGTISADGGVDP